MFCNQKRFFFKDYRVHVNIKNGTSNQKEHQNHNYFFFIKWNALITCQIKKKLTSKYKRLFNLFNNIDKATLTNTKSQALFKIMFMVKGNKKTA